VNHRSTLAQKDQLRRITRMERHFQTDFSQCKGIRELGVKQCVPVVVDEELMVETELGCLSLYEVYGEGEGVPDPDQIAKGLAEIRSLRRMPEDEPKEYSLPVCDTWNVSGPIRRGKESTR
jgi:hypothetical protein